MRKFLVLIVALFATISASAQFYVGGSVGISTTKVTTSGNSDSKTSFRILPEFGYSINNNLTVGASFGYEKGASELLETSDVKAFSFNPFARYTFAKISIFSMFVDGCIDYSHLKAADEKISANSFGIGVKPGIAVSITDNFCFATRLGFLGYNIVNSKDIDSKIETFGFDFSGYNITFGLFYNF